MGGKTGYDVEILSRPIRERRESLAGRRSWPAAVFIALQTSMTLSYGVTSKRGFENCRKYRRIYMYRRDVPRRVPRAATECRAEVGKFMSGIRLYVYGCLVWSQARGSGR